MTDRIVGYRVAAAALAVVAVFAWIGYARAARHAGGVGVGLWLGVAVSATVFSAAAAAVGSVASLLRLQAERSAVLRR